MRRPVGVKWVLLFFCWTRFFSGRVSHCRHPSIRTLVSDLASLGACWAFSFQPVLLSVWRPVILLSRESNLGQAIDAVTGTRLWALAFPFLRMFRFYAAAGIALCWRLCSGSYASPLTHK